MQRTDDAELLTTAEVARRRRVDPSTILRWADSGKLPVVKVGPKTYRYHRADVDALLTPEPASQPVAP